ncbi:NAD(P)H-binding protein [Arthrobacter sp.]|uniref:SDR family oxidoreductase n=1 Tax=Arthrobacter sp. TaxID=1667 RepID=UPI002811E4C3|nr:NAD(P)H-binding protein [Arthrobacter sp.]
MIRICIAGGTGQVGAEVVRQALERGIEVSAFSRRPPMPGTAKHHDGAAYWAADVATGSGVAEALAGADVVVDCLEGRSRKAIKGFADGGDRLLHAAKMEGVRKVVLLSIINCDQVRLGYQRSKAEKERRYAGSDVETVVVRTTQFHSLLAEVFSAGSRVRLTPVFKGARFQTISPSEAAAALLEEALGSRLGELHRVRTVGGPEILPMRSMAQIWQTATHARGKVIELPLPGSMGEYLREGQNLIPEQTFGRETFPAWLAKNADSL